MAFNLPAQTGLAPLKPASTDAWIRPVDWPTITDAPNEVQFLVADTGLATYAINTTFSRTASQDLLIDWGDGTTDTISTTTTVTTQHSYAVGTGTPCSRGYTTFKIRIYGSAAGVTITNSRFVILTTAVNGSIPVAINTWGVLEAYFGNGFDASTFANYFQGNIVSTIGSSQGNFAMLEYCKLPSTFNATSFNQAFDYCYSLAVLVMPTSAPNMTSFNLCFRQCVNLQSVTFPPDATGITTLGNTFNNCQKLTSITLPTTLDLCTNLFATFINCTLLNTISLPSLGTCTDYGNTFSQCASLVNVKLTGWTSSPYVGITTSSMFNGCTSLSLINIPNPVAGSSMIADSMFFGCTSLLQCILPSNFIGGASSMFSGCSNLITAVFPTTTNGTAFDSIFANCFNLVNVTLPTTAGATVSMANTFLGCRSLRSITIPSGYNLTTCSSIAQNCFSLTSFTFPTGAQNSLTFLTSAFSGCTSLETVTLPNSMTSCSSLSSAFQNCSKLDTVTLPATMNLVTSMASAFSGCSNLSSVTLPTSMSALTGTGFTNAFQNCYNLITCTLPATVASGLTTLSNTFNGCTALKTITLPTIQTTLFNSLSSAFVSCANLTTINNVPFLGSTLTGGAVVDGATMTTSCGQLTSLDFYCKFSRLTLQGTATNRNNLTSLRLRNNSSSGPLQYNSTSPQIQLAYTNLDTAALNQVFTDLPSLSSKTIDITGATGAATCTRSIATAKGWTVTG
jgi:hypothetical protein